MKPIKIEFYIFKPAEVLGVVCGVLKTENKKILPVEAVFPPG